MFLLADNDNKPSNEYEMAAKIPNNCVDDYDSRYVWLIMLMNGLWIIWSGMRFYLFLFSQFLIMVVVWWIQNNLLHQVLLLLSYSSRYSGLIIWPGLRACLSFPFFLGSSYKCILTKFSFSKYTNVHLDDESWSQLWTKSRRPVLMTIKNWR